MERARRQGAALTLAMIDLDEFKGVNDAYGHSTGDRVLVALSRLLQQRLRKTDIIGRYGGEEFTVVLCDTGLEQSRLILDSIREMFSKIRHRANDNEFTVTFSCGLASFPPHADAIGLGNAADAALYQAKREGRNRIVTDDC
jgi:diguanylate cyclase (GGDEF)-like protein